MLLDNTPTSKRPRVRIPRNSKHGMKLINKSAPLAGLRSEAPHDASSSLKTIARRSAVTNTTDNN